MQKTFISQIDKYDVLSEYAKGGMGTTYLVKSRNSGETLILKELQMKKLKDWKVVELFQREVQVLKSLNHPGIPAYVDYVETKEGNPALVQTYIKGRTLQELIEQKVTVSSDDFKDYLSQALNILDYLHKRVPPVIHRDINPKNIIINDGRIFLVDFGAVKHALVSNSTMYTVVGTFGYMAPEQMMGQAQTGSDLYGLGMSFMSWASLSDPTQLPLDSETGQINVKNLLNLPEKIESVLESMTRINLTERLTDAGRGLWILNSIPDSVEGRQSLTSPYVTVTYKSINEVFPIKTGKTVIRNELNLVKYIEEDDSWYEHLVKDKSGYDMLLRWVSQVKDIEAKNIFNRMVKYYDEYGKRYVKEAILRYFIPEKPVEIGALVFDFFCEEQIAEAVINFFHALDEVWKEAELNDIQFWIFQFEYSLRKLKEFARGEILKSISKKIEELTSIIKIHSKDNFKDYKCVFFKKVNNEALLRVFYHYFPERVFKDLSGRTYKSLKDVGLFFAQSRKWFFNPYLTLEKEKYLIKLKQNALMNLPYNDFLFKIFSEHIISDVRIAQLDFKKNRKCTVKYEITGKSLSDFLYKNKIKNTVDEKNKSEKIILPAKNYFHIFGLFRAFIKKLKVKNDINTLSDHSKRVFKNSANQYLKQICKKDALYILKMLCLLLPAAVSYFFFRAFAGNDPQAFRALDFLWFTDLYKMPVARDFLYHESLFTALLYLLPLLISAVPRFIRFLIHMAKKFSWLMVLVQLFASPIVVWLWIVAMLVSEPRTLSMILLAAIPAACIVVYFIRKELRLFPLLFSLLLIFIAGMSVYTLM